MRRTLSSHSARVQLYITGRQHGGGSWRRVEAGREGEGRSYHDNIVPPLVSAPLHMLPFCLFVCLFILVPWHHVSLALFVYFPFQIVSIVDRQQANAKSNCTHCIRRGLGRRLSSLLLNSSPRCDPPCKISYLTF